MNWDALGAVGELLGGLVVIATLLYLARQLSQTNKISKSSVARELQQKYTDLYTLIASDPGINSLVTRLRSSDYVPQSEEEEEQLESFGLILCGIWLGTGIAYTQGQMEQNLYEVYCKDVEVKLSKWPGMHDQLKDIMKTYPSASAFEIFEPINS
jgi:hypothetical protein